LKDAVVLVSSISMTGPDCVPNFGSVIVPFEPGTMAMKPGPVGELELIGRVGLRLP
jgi:hypothetical protein